MNLEEIEQRITELNNEISALKKIRKNLRRTPLIQRNAEIMGLIAQGVPLVEIGQRIGISGNRVAQIRNQEQRKARFAELRRQRELA